MKRFKESRKRKKNHIIKRGKVLKKRSPQKKGKV